MNNECCDACNCTTEVQFENKIEEVQEEKRGLYS